MFRNQLEIQGLCVCQCVSVCVRMYIHFGPLPANDSIDTLINWIIVNRVTVFYEHRLHHHSIDEAVFASEVADVYELDP